MYNEHVLVIIFYYTTLSGISFVTNNFSKTIWCSFLVRWHYYYYHMVNLAVSGAPYCCTTSFYTSGHTFQVKVSVCNIVASFDINMFKSYKTTAAWYSIFCFCYVNGHIRWPIAIHSTEQRSSSLGILVVQQQLMWYMEVLLSL